MKQIRVNFNINNLGCLEYDGEHNRTELIFSLSEELAMCDYVNAEFITADGTKHVRESYILNAAAKTLTGLMDIELAVEGLLQIQLVGYVVPDEGEAPQVIIKSPVVNAYISRSVNGVEAQTQGKKDLLERLQLAVKAIKEKLHEHTNLKTLAKLKSRAAENPNGGLVLGNEYTGLTFDNNPVRMMGHGRVVSGVNEIEKDGQKYIRLRFSADPYGVILENIPNFIDIPIAAAQNAVITQGSLTLNGSSLDLGVDKHVPMPLVYTRPGTVTLSPNTAYSFGEAAELDISLLPGEPEKYCEYIFSFTSGETPTVLTLPADIKWANELSIEAGKAYEISIVNSVALWAAVAP